MINELTKWPDKNKKDWIRVCNSVDRKYLSGRLPYPYTEESADRWYKTLYQETKKRYFRAAAVDNEFVDSISVEPRYDIYIKDAEIGYMLLTEYHGKGIITEAI